MICIFIATLLEHLYWNPNPSDTLAQELAVVKVPAEHLHLLLPVNSPEVIALLQQRETRQSIEDRKGALQLADEVDNEPIQTIVRLN